MNRRSLSRIMTSFSKVNGSPNLTRSCVGQPSKAALGLFFFPVFLLYPSYNLPSFGVIMIRGIAEIELNLK